MIYETAIEAVKAAYTRLHAYPGGQFAVYVDRHQTDATGMDFADHMGTSLMTARPHRRIAARVER